MKKINTKIITLTLTLILVITLLPSFFNRIKNEKANNNIIVSLYYNDIENRFNKTDLETVVNNFKSIGVNVVSVSEENLNGMVARGDVTNIKYNVLRHKYDDESILLANIIAENVPDISYNSELIISKDPATADFIRKSLNEKYTDAEFCEIELDNQFGNSFGKTYVFCFYEGTLPTHEIVFGYNTETLDMLKENGFDICLVLKAQAVSNTEYLNTIESIIKEYDVKYLNIRLSSVSPKEGEDGKEHYSNISRIIKENDMTLVVTENPDHLSNEKPFGYDEIFAENNTRVLRSYETYDASNRDASNYLFRYQQYLNSTLDRNIRFITVSQIYIEKTPYMTLHEYTLKAVETYIDKITSLGFNVNPESINEFDYDVDLTPVNAAAAAIMVLLAYIMLCVIFSIENKNLFFAFIALAAACFGITFALPESLVALYPTAWAVIMPCFGLTAVFAFLKYCSHKLNTIICAIIVPGIVVAVMSIGGIVMSSLLSGIDYYINNDIFRGIKLSLFMPIVFAVVAYYFMFIVKKNSMISDIGKIAMSEIKVFWVIIGAVVAIVALIYIRRSGNVNTISSAETAMRNIITDLFAARPRTKEFLVGYPCLVLLVYYFKKTDLKLLCMLLSMGSAILTASVSNSFCHVFTDVSTIYMRVINGIIIGAVVSIAVYILNLLFVFIVKKLYSFSNKS